MIMVACFCVGLELGFWLVYRAGVGSNGGAALLWLEPAQRRRRWRRRIMKPSSRRQRCLPRHHNKVAFTTVTATCHLVHAATAAQAFRSVRRCRPQERRGMTASFQAPKCKITKNTKKEIQKAKNFTEELFRIALRNVAQRCATS